jgi:hypothetical protein
MFSRSLEFYRSFRKQMGSSVIENQHKIELDEKGPAFIMN